MRVTAEGGGRPGAPTHPIAPVLHKVEDTRTLSCWPCEGICAPVWGGTAAWRPHLGSVEADVVPPRFDAQPHPNCTLTRCYRHK